MNKMGSTVSMPEHISHIRRTITGEIACFQSNEEHCQHVAHLAKCYAAEFGMAEWAYVLGLLHDKGKEKHQFQEYIRDVNGIPGHASYTQEGKAHAYVGALMAHSLYGPQAKRLFCNQIASHHRGLYDYYELEQKLRLPMPEEIMPLAEKPVLNRPPFKMSAEDFHHLSRMMFSCLVDADYLDTEAFMDERVHEMRGCHTSLRSLLPLLEQHLEMLGQAAPPSEVNRLRREVHTSPTIARFVFMPILLYLFQKNI